MGDPHAAGAVPHRQPQDLLAARDSARHWVHHPRYPEVHMTSLNGPLRIGIGGPVGSGKTTLCEMLLKRMRERYSMAVVTNDIYTKEDALILSRVQAIAEDRIVGVETGGCPHTAIREDASRSEERRGEKEW